MKGKKQLEIYLASLEQKENYINFLEQYPTDSSTAAYVLNLAFNDGNISGKKVIDLGTGNGIFALGASVLGASEVTGIDVDEEQIAVARRNSGSSSVIFETKPVESVTGIYDTVLMNAPFGSVKIHSDVPFLEKAVEIGRFVYSLHNRKTSEFVRNFYSHHGTVFRSENIDITVGRLYKHHKKERDIIPAVFFSVEIQPRRH